VDLSHYDVDPLFIFKTSKRMQTSDFSNPWVVFVPSTPGLIKMDAMEVDRNGNVYYSDASKRQIIGIQKGGVVLAERIRDKISGIEKREFFKKAFEKKQDM
jgi:hypothetical protein